jgi:excisionase family DNA binding protein
MDNKDFSDLISQKEAAELRGVSRSAVNELVKRGRLKVIEIAGKKFLSRQEVESFEGQKGKRLEEKLDTNDKAAKPTKEKSK